MARAKRKEIKTKLPHKDIHAHRYTTPSIHTLTRIHGMHLHSYNSFFLVHLKINFPISFFFCPLAVQSNQKKIILMDKTKRKNRC